MTQLPSINSGESSRGDKALPKKSNSKPVFEIYSVDIPLIEDVFEGYFSNRLDIKLTTRQQATLKAILFGLQSKFAKLENGKEVANAVDAVKWILENVR